MELCNALSKGGIQSAEIMVEHLGQIGHNQYKELPTEEFNKKSYPLPRDIIARTLAHMKEDILPILLDVFKTNNTAAIREVIDAIGFICFYNKVNSDTQFIEVLKQCLKNHYKDDMIRWKLVRAFESFNNINVIQTLMGIGKHDSQMVIRNEARRSLRIINSRIEN